MSYLRADVLLSFFHTEIRSRAQYARRIFPQRKRRLRASYLLERYPVALFPFLFISDNNGNSFKMLLSAS